MVLRKYISNLCKQLKDLSAVAVETGIENRKDGVNVWKYGIRRSKLICIKYCGGNRFNLLHSNGVKAGAFQRCVWRWLMRGVDVSIEFLAARVSVVSEISKEDGIVTVRLSLRNPINFFSLTGCLINGLWSSSEYVRTISVQCYISILGPWWTNNEEQGLSLELILYEWRLPVLPSYSWHWMDSAGWHHVKYPVRVGLKSIKFSRSRLWWC